MKRNLKALCFLCITLCLFLIGCGGPSPEKITQAQDIYTQLTQIHNQVVEAHKGITDNSLDDKLIALADKVMQVESYNLNEMSDEEIDLLIETMNTIIVSYQEYLSAIETIKAEEDAAVLTPISLTILNETEFTFSKLILHETNNSATKFDVLEGMDDYVPGQYLTGLIVYRNATSTPWILELENVDGTAFEIELPVDTYTEGSRSLSLTYDSELEELKCS